MDNLIIMITLISGIIIGYNVRIKGFAHQRMLILKDCLKELERIDQNISKKLILTDDEVKDLNIDMENIFIKYHEEIDTD